MNEYCTGSRWDLTGRSIGLPVNRRFTLPELPQGVGSTRKQNGWHRLWPLAKQASVLTSFYCSDSGLCFDDGVYGAASAAQNVKPHQTRFATAFVLKKDLHLKNTNTHVRPHPSLQSVWSVRSSLSETVLKLNMIRHLEYGLRRHSRIDSTLSKFHRPLP